MHRAPSTPDVQRVGAPLLPVLVWRLPRPMRAIASAAMGGGLGERHWVLNAQVPKDYARVDVDDHLAAVARATGCVGPGVGFLTAASVEEWTVGSDGDVVAYATVGLLHPTWAASVEDGAVAPTPGTVNIVAFVPVRLSDAAFVNAVSTLTEAKTQALIELGVPGTGTASDAACVLSPTDGAVEPFGGPRSPLGARLARAVHAAVRAGAAGWTARHAASMQ